MTAFDINSLITTLSCFGTYQKWKFLFISLAVAFSCVQYSYVFNTRSTTYRCFVDECDSSENQTYDQPWLENAIPYDGSAFRKCERYATILEANPDETILACEPESFNQSDIQRCDKLVLEEEVSTIEHDFGLTCEDNLWKLTIVGSLDEIGKVVSSPFAGYFSDRYGRKVVLIISLVMSAIFGVVKAVAPSYAIFAFMEFTTACFTSAIYGCVYIFAVELLVPQERVFGSTITAMAFPCGQILVGIAAWFAPSWRIMLLALHAPGVLFISFYWLLDDSLCFLVANGRIKQTARIIKRIAKANKVEIPDNLETHLKQTIKVEKNTDKKSDNIDEENTLPSETVCQIFNYPSLLLRVLNCSFTWISCTFVYYGLTVYSVSLTGNIYLNFIIMAVIELPAYVVCYYILDHFGRRYTSGGSLLISGAACLACAFIPAEMWVVQLVLPMVGKFTATLAYKTVYIYTAEMFPTTLRHTLLAFCSMFGRIGSIAAPQLPILTSISPLLPPILFGILGMSAGIFVFFLPETTGCKLPDTLEEAVETGRDQKPHKTV